MVQYLKELMDQLASAPTTSLATGTKYSSKNNPRILLRCLHLDYNYGGEVSLHFQVIAQQVSPKVTVQKLKQFI